MKTLEEMPKTELREHPIWEQVWDNLKVEDPKLVLTNLVQVDQKAQTLIRAMKGSENYREDWMAIAPEILPENLEEVTLTEKEQKQFQRMSEQVEKILEERDEKRHQEFLKGQS